MILISKLDARKFLLKKHHLYGEKLLSGKEDILTFIRQVGCLQFDPIDVCGKNADLVLQSRIKHFSKNELYEMIYQDRVLVDYFDKNLSIFSIEDWPYFARERVLYTEKGKSKEEIDEVCSEILETIKIEGPKTSSELEYEHKVDWYWGHTKLSRAALELLYFKGELGIHSKKGSNKRYDLMKNLYPESLVKAPDPKPDLFDHLCWRVKRRIGAVGMLWNRPSDAWLNIRELKAVQRKEVFEALERKGEIIPLQVEGVKDLFYILESDLDLLSSVLTHQEESERVEFIAPLDNLLWDRKLIIALFDFNYKWEIYTPESKRAFGYYVLPILYRSEFVGRIEMVCQRKEKTLMVKNIWFEQGFKPSVSFEKSFESCLQEFMLFNEMCFQGLNLINFLSMGIIKVCIKETTNFGGNMRTILGIQVGDREHEAVKVQELLTKHGCIIKARLGLHEASTKQCSSKGLILLEFLPDTDEEIGSMEAELSVLDSVTVRKMVF